MSTVRYDVEPHVLLRVQGCAGDVEIVGHEEAAVEIEADEAIDRFVRQDNGSITIIGYLGDLEIRLPHHASVELSGIGGDVEVRSIANVEAQGSPKLVANSVGGDISISDVPEIQLGSIGGDVEIEGRCESLQVGNVGGDLQLERAVVCDIQTIGGDAEVREVVRLVKLGHIGGDLSLRWSGGADDDIRTIVGGDVEMRLPVEVDLKLVAMTGGDFSGRGAEWNINKNSGRHELVFGEGRNRISLTVGGDLDLRGGSAPQGSSSENDGTRQKVHESMNDFGEELRGLGRELEEMGRSLAKDLSNLGRDIAREVRVAGRETMRGVKGDFGPRGWNQRPRVRINEHEFQLDPEQVERIKREARAAAASGVARAQEAVERALHQWQQGGGPRRPNAPRQPTPPNAPMPPNAPTPPEPPVGHVYTGQTIRMDTQSEVGSGASSTGTAATAGSNDLDAERLAILRMVHEGRLGPDEAEVLLRGLEDRR